MKTIIKIVTPFLIIIIFGSAGYALIEGWNIFNGIYMTVMNVIALGGLAELKQISPQGRIFTMLLKFVSMAIIFVIFYIFIRTFINYVNSELSEKWKFYTTGNKNEKIHLLYFQKSVSGYAGRLYDRMVEYFGTNRFTFWNLSREGSYDNDLTKFSAEFSRPGLAIFILGPNWEKEIDIKTPAQSLSYYIEKVLKIKMPILPVLVKGAKIPSATSDNKLIVELARHQAFSLSDIRWKDDIENLIETIDKEIIFAFYGTNERISSRTIKIKRDGRLYKNYIILFITIWLSCILIGTAGYMFVEAWNFLDSIYMTIMNVVAFGGLGETNPMSYSGRMLTLILKIISVIAAFGLITNILKLYILRQTKEFSNYNKQLDSNKKIFISYRRVDSSGHTGRLYDHLIKGFIRQNIFIDIDSIQPGDDFNTRIKHFLDNSDLFITVVGQNWVGNTEDGERRIDSANDFVRIELLEAIKKKIPIIAVLVQGVKEAELDWIPDDLGFEGFYKSIQMDDFSWQEGVNKIYNSIVSTQN